ncbi:penicillin binding transpeptidase domain protein [Mycobacterium kansasii 824]|nr:penicillin binding transpeptidase domain protein [Mycobacterium kansasii 824]
MVGAEKVTQQKGAIPGVQIASKTGTAEHGTDPRHTPPHAWYIAFAPAQAPRVAIAVFVENGAIVCPRPVARWPHRSDGP